MNIGMLMESRVYEHQRIQDLNVFLKNQNQVVNVILDSDVIQKQKNACLFQLKV